MMSAGGYQPKTPMHARSCSGLGNDGLDHGCSTRSRTSPSACSPVSEWTRAWSQREPARLGDGSTISILFGEPTTASGIVCGIQSNVITETAAS
jgi:hypothetical protein